MKRYAVLISSILLLVLSLHAQKSAVVRRAPIDTSKFVLVEGGSFMMGTDKPVEKHESPPHRVMVKSFYLAKTECTFEDFDKFTSDTKRDTVPSGTWGR